MPYNFLADDFHTNKLCSRLSSREVQFKQKMPFCIFEPRLEGLMATYDVYLRLTGKRIVNFLLVLNEHFSLGVTSKYGLKIGVFARMEQFGPKF